VVIRKGPLPEHLIAAAVMYERKTRRAFRVSFVCAIITALCAGWNLADVIGKLLAG